MTTLYRPVPITNLDQANALPRGSVVFDGDPEDGQTYYRSGDDWYADGHPGLMSIAVECGTPVTALVPIEAEEETHSIQTRGQTTPEWRTRLVTPWEPQEPTQD